MRLIRRFRAEFALAVIASFVCIGLAVAGRGRYDPNLAVLTATLVVLVWYTFFTYCAVHREEVSSIGLAVQRTAASTVEVIVSNRSSIRRVTVRLRIQGQRDGAPMTMPVGVDGGGENDLSLLAGESRTEVITLAAAKSKPGSQYGPGIDLGESEQAILCVALGWRDDVNDSSSLGPDFWAVDVLDAKVRRYQRTSSALDAWRRLGGEKVSPIAI
ncbi:MAG: hypothetical protein Q7S20_09885 [Gemmatimonadaceae bacterium]|nr:hypothetical protein [Gemmatimonadaceae bacterium]